MSLLGSSWTKPDRPSLEYITTSRQIKPQPAPPFRGRRRGRRRAPLDINVSPNNSKLGLLPPLAGRDYAPSLLNNLILPPLAGRFNSAPSGAGPADESGQSSSEEEAEEENYDDDYDDDDDDQDEEDDSLYSDESDDDLTSDDSVSAETHSILGYRNHDASETIANLAVKACFRKLRRYGVREIPFVFLRLGNQLDHGSFGVVYEGVWLTGGREIPVAVKTSTRDDDLREVLELFELEVRMAWLASANARSGRSSYIVSTHGISVSWPNGEGIGSPELHLIMERLSCDGDLHDEIDRTENWILLRCNGVDTGAPFRNQLVMHTGLDVWAYRMNRRQKVKISIELTRALIELKEAKILHCDIKPANTVLHQPAHGWPVLKLIDFGEANTVEDAMGDIAGTPGYMAPEMEKTGSASTGSDMYSTGMYLLELWVGYIGQQFDDYSGYTDVGAAGVRAIRLEVAQALSRLATMEPKIANVIRRCLARDPSSRPTPTKLLKILLRLEKKKKGKGQEKGKE